MSARAWLAAIGCVLALGAAAASLTESEKALLQSGMSESTAMELGKAADAAGLARIIAIGDPALIGRFDNGMAIARIEVMPPDIEALVVKHFDDPKVGAQLRGHRARYTTRALFDKHYARLQGAYRSDEPSFGQIVRTELSGIEEELLHLAPKWPVQRGQPNGAVQFVARRKHPAAVPLLIASLDESFQGYKPVTHYHPVLSLLVDYPSADVWRQAGAEVERLRAAGRITDEQYAAAHRQLDPLLKDPDAAVARMKSRDAYAAYVSKRNAIRPGLGEIRPLRDSSPGEYVDAMQRYIERLEALAAEMREEQVDYEVASQYGSLGAYVRFQQADPARAVPFLEKSAKGRDLVGQLLLADTYQLALDTASRQPPGSRITPYAGHDHPMNAFWREWLAAEVEYLRTGKRFAGRVSEPAIGGFWEALGVWVRVATISFPEWTLTSDQLGLVPARAMGPVGGTFGVAGGRAIAPVPTAPSWEAISGRLAAIDRTKVGARLTKVPPSRFSLFVTLRFVSALPDADAILRELARHDPSGYWTTVALGTIAFHERSPGARDEALANGVAELAPGMAAPGKPNALASAARRHLQARELRVVEKKP